MIATPEEVFSDPAQFIDDLQREWLRPIESAGGAAHRILFATNRAMVRASLRLEVEGVSMVPRTTQAIFAPNHESSLDAPLLAAALPYVAVRRTYWAARKGRVLSNLLTRAVGRVAQIMPIDRDVTALAVGAEILRRGFNLVWFPEGTRSRDGNLQEFKYGVGALARHSGVPIIPVRIDGAFEAMPADRSILRPFSKVAVRFGDPLTADDYCDAGSEVDYERSKEVADEVRDRVEELS